MLHPQMSVQRIYLKINRHSFSDVLQLNLAAWFKKILKKKSVQIMPLGIMTCTMIFICLQYDIRL